MLNKNKTFFATFLNTFRPLFADLLYLLEWVKNVDGLRNDLKRKKESINQHKEKQ